MVEPTPNDRNQVLSVPPSAPSQRVHPTSVLSTSLTSIVGRERDVAAALTLLRDPHVRLLTLTGPGGVGKTRLALQLVEEIDESIANAVVVVLLAPIGDSGLVGATIMHALGIRNAGDGDVMERAAAVIGTEKLLLVLDNFEHVLDAAGVLVGLLTSCPNLIMLVTSRSVLRISGEHGFDVLPLVVPNQDQPVDQLIANDAVRLFTGRAQASRSQFAVTPENAPAIAAICARLDGLPLAIELAAARSSVLSPQAMLIRLDHRLPILTGGPRDAPLRQKTMRDAIAWSHDLLPLEEQVFFRQLSVFAGGFTLEAAEAVSCEAENGKPGNGSAPPASRFPLPVSVIDLVDSLVGKSLLHQTGGDGEPRFGMLETVREYGLELLEASGEAESVRRSHAAYFLELAEAAEPELYGGGTQVEWLDRLTAEHDNLRAALGWSVAADPGTALRIAGGIFWFWYSRSHLREGRRWLERTLDSTAGTDHPARARALLGVGMLADRMGDAAAATAAFQQSLALAREQENMPVTWLTLGLMGLEAEDAGDYAKAIALLEEALAIDSGPEGRVPRPLVRAAVTHLGINTWGQGETERAVGLWEETLARQEQNEDIWGSANIYGYLGLVACEQGNLIRAAELLGASLANVLRTASPEDTAMAIANLATLLARRGEPDRAARLFGAAEAVREAIGSRLGLPERDVYEYAVNAARTALGESVFSAAWTAGRRLSVEAAVAEARGSLAAPEPALSGAADRRPGIDLTPRELDVLQLLAEGLTDKEIGEALFISWRTAQGHVASILAKLGVGTRAAAAAAAIRNGLVTEADAPTP